MTHEITVGAPTYQYDHCGNQAIKQEAAGTTYYEYDHENLLTQIDLADGGHNYFAYDADSKRVRAHDTYGTTQFIYQGPNMLALLQERDGADNAIAHYTMGNGLEAMPRDAGQGLAAGSSSFYHYDALGSTFELTDSDQDVTDTYLYNAWGEVLDRTGTTRNPHAWVGRERYYEALQALLYQLGLRYYDLRLGRFTTIDPTGEGVDWFLYVDNSPANRTDASGLVSGAIADGTNPNLDAAYGADGVPAECYGNTAKKPWYKGSASLFTRAETNLPCGTCGICLADKNVLGFAWLIQSSPEVWKPDPKHNPGAKYACKGVKLECVALSQPNRGKTIIGYIMDRGDGGGPIAGEPRIIDMLPAAYDALFTDEPHVCCRSRGVADFPKHWKRCHKYGDCK